MIDPDILERFGTTKDRIRKLFTAEKGTCDGDLREKFETRIEARVNEGIAFNLRNYKLYAASDLAWDSQPLTKEIVPLMAYAQGKIDFKQVKQQLKDLPIDTLKKFADLDTATNEIKSINLSQFHEVWVNLVRSYITRRTATLSVGRTKLYPYLKYEPQSTSFVAKLRGDVLSQRIEMMTNQYGYRHDLPQAIRDTLLYGHTLEFPTGAWDVEKQLFKKPRAAGFDTTEDSEFDIEARVVREGVTFARPHPTRVFWDNAFPLSSVNTDTGVNYLGYWTVTRFSEVDKNPAYFNRDNVGFASRAYSLLVDNKAFFELYFPSAPIAFPNIEKHVDPSMGNDREHNVGFYAAEHKDMSVSLVEYRERVIPKEVGLGDYPFPVWVRLVVAGARTVVYGEILPSTPAIYYGYNEDDSRQVNSAFAHEIMPWQDQASNILTQLLCTQKTGLIKVLCANIDILTPEQIKEFRAIIKGERYTAGPTLLEFEGLKLRDLDIDIDSVFKMHEANSLGDVTIFFRSILQLLSLAERVLNVSAQELGQSAPREISATEVAEISNTTNTMASYIGLGIDEALAAKKKLLYESLIAMGRDQVYVPAVNRYLPATIKAAGFELVSEDNEADVQENYSGNNKRSQTVTGSKTALIFDYNFTSRDGSERAVNSKAAEVLVNLLAQMSQIPEFLQDLGKDKLHEYLNTIVRLSGAGIDLTFQLQDGESGTLPPSDGVTQHKDEIQSAIKQILDAVQQDRQDIQNIKSFLASQGSGIPAGPPPPQAPMTGPPPGAGVAPAMPMGTAA